jgi:hypothetical protein
LLTALSKCHSFDAIDGFGIRENAVLGQKAANSTRFTALLHYGNNEAQKHWPAAYCASGLPK